MHRSANWSLSASARNYARRVVAGLALLAFVHAAGADLKPVPPFCVTVTADAPMKCMGGSPFYAVRSLPAGQVMRVDGEDGPWLRVEYLPGMQAYVKAEEVSVAADTKSVKLLRPSRLSAVNNAVDGRGNWWYLLDQELPEGTNLVISEPVTAINGTVVGYLVEAPAQSRGYLKTEVVRKATTEEAATYRGIVVAAAPAPAKLEATPADGGATPAGTATPALATAEAPLYDLDQLRVRFEKAMAREAEESELVRVIGDFDRKLATLTFSTEDRRLRSILEQRLVALKLRRDVLSALKRIQNSQIATAADAK